MEPSVIEVPVEHVTAKPVRRRRAKGEKSRQTILDAALVSIAKLGLHNVTHRVIAAEADVPLSLTTYFFKSLTDLIEQAFDHFTAQVESDHERVFKAMADYLAQYAPQQFNDESVRTAIKLNFTDILTDFLTSITIEHPTGIAVELNFLYLYRLEPALRVKAEAHRARLVSSIASILRPLSTDAAQAEIDAELVLCIMHRLEFDCLNSANTMSTDRLRTHVGRQISHIIDMTRSTA
ncbi:hypothetical protein KSF73_09445 [Burkholderiaceae bacterium DAT-1]|nr:hypothetical protein [Burkholderiaceae bacterium DAT-1]